jgi:hypothetical protein
LKVKEIEDPFKDLALVAVNVEHLETSINVDFIVSESSNSILASKIQSTQDSAVIAAS